MTYKNAIIFIAGLACGFIGFWLVGILLTPNPSVSDNQSTTDNQPATSVTDILISSPTTQEEHSVSQTATASLTLQSVPTPTRTELLAYQMALRSGREMESTQKFYQEMLPYAVRICDDMDGMSDVVNWQVRTHERILDLGLSDPGDLVDVSFHIYSILVKLGPIVSKYEEDLECEVLTRIYVEFRMQDDSGVVARDKILNIIEEAFSN